MRTVSTRVATMLVSALTLLSAILGFGRDSYIAFAFGATRLTDAYLIATIVPDMIAGWISYTLTNALIPPLKMELLRSPRSAKSLSGAALRIAAVGLVVLLLVTYVWRYQAIAVLAPGFTKLELHQVGEFLKIMILGVFLSGISGVLWGIHNAHENYTVPALVGIVNNLTMIGMVVCLRPWLGIYALPYGFVGGLAMRVLVQLIPLLRRRTVSLLGSMWHPAMTHVIRAMPPILLSTGVGTVNMVVDRMLASGLPSGRITDLSFASKLGLFPATVVGMSVATTLYTKFVVAYEEQNDEALLNLVYKGLVMVVCVGLIVTAEFILLGRNMLAVLFQHGQFNSSDVNIASHPLMVYGCFAVFYLMSPVLTHIFYARTENRLVTRASVTGMLFNIIGSILFVRYLGISGLVLANGLSQLIFSGIIVWVLSRRLAIDVLSFTKIILKESFLPAASFICGLTIVVLVWHISVGSVPSSMMLFGRVAVSTGVGAVFMVIFTRVNRSNLISQLLWGTIRKRVMVGISSK